MRCETWRGTGWRKESAVRDREVRRRGWLLLQMIGRRRFGCFLQCLQNLIAILANLIRFAGQWDQA